MSETPLTDCPFSSDPTNHVIIGIDPGVHTGIALWRPKIKQFEAIDRMKIHKAMGIIKAIVNQTKEEGAIVEIYCENPNTFVPFKKNPNASATAQGAGSIKRDFRIWKDYCEEELNVPFFSVRLQKERKKMKAEQFKDLTGWDGRTNEHSRDAAMLVFEKDISTQTQSKKL